MTTARFLEPLDVLFLRGNRLFGDPGSHGEALVPPWPSVAAGAIRSQTLAESGIDLAAFARGGIDHPQLGTPDNPGPFTVTGFWLARHDDAGQIEPLHPLPADLIASRGVDGLTVSMLHPAAPATELACSAPLPRLPALARDSQAKPTGGIWLTDADWRRYLDGDCPAPGDLVESDQLWSVDHRVGVGLDPARRRADDGKLFSMQAVVLHAGHGFLVTVDGAEPPGSGVLRLGGDGRGAAVRAVDYQPPKPDYAAICATHRARLVLTTPGIFPEGWRLPGMTEDGRFELAGVRGRVTAAAVGRAEVISGWDLARWRPKAAQRAAPTGSVYWLEELEATPEQLRKLAGHGLWPERDYDAQRRSEGFNRFVWGVWK